MSALIIKGGMVYDPFKKKYEKQDLGIKDGRILLEYKEDIQETEAEIVDAGDCVIVPGLIDYHIHLYTGCDGGVSADPICLPSGVTTAVDGGTCGASSFEMFVKSDIERALTEVKGYLNISSGGLASGLYPENIDPVYYEKEKIKYLFGKYPDRLTALKLRLSKNIAGLLGLTREPLEKTIEIAEEIGCPVVVHMTDPVISPEEAASIMRPGDVFCHMYYGKGDTIIDEEGHVKKEILKARERGVLFDGCNGKNNFAFQVAAPAAEEGFWPDIISTDISPMSFYRHPVVNMPRLLSKYMAMGMSFKQVIDCATIAPARQLGMEKELGSLETGTAADILILKIKEQPVSFYDYAGNSVNGAKVIVPQMTIKSGNIVFCQSDFH